MATERIPQMSIFILPSRRAAATSRVNSGGSDSTRLVKIKDKIYLIEVDETGLLVSKSLEAGED